MPCLPVPICMHLLPPGENFWQPDIGEVCPFSGKGAEKQRNTCGIAAFFHSNDLFLLKKIVICRVGMSYTPFIQRFPKLKGSKARR